MITMSERLATLVQNGYELYEKERSEKPKFKIEIERPTGVEKVADCSIESEAIMVARNIDSKLLPWEKVKITFKGETIPYKVYVSEREAGNVIEEIKGYSLTDSINKAAGIIEQYEEEDKLSDMYESDFYDIINEFGESYVY